VPIGPQEPGEGMDCLECFGCGEVSTCEVDRDVMAEALGLYNHQVTNDEVEQYHDEDEAQQAISEDARLQFQDWFTPWTELVGADRDVLIAYAGHFISI
jgi:hypothetical protein